jgi:DNA repair exonuclease SbcCD nuclease subunit
MLRTVLHLLLFWGIAALTGCYYTSNPSPTTDTRPTYRPIYGTYDAVRSIQTVGPQVVKTPGKIYIKDNYLFVSDVGLGIHIVDNRDPTKPVRIAFVSIPGNHDLAVKDSILYADNTVDLVALNIANPRNVRLVKRIENAFPYPAFPVERNVRFECADPDKGVVLRWEQASVTNPQCSR